MSKGYTLDEASKAFQDEIEAIVRKWANGEDTEYVRRWRQLYSWGMSRSQGDVIKKSALKKKLMRQTNGKCMDCGLEFGVESLQMHRIDQRFALDRSKNMGYFDENVALVCAPCHAKRESYKR
jgi:5-methylcytosine-specific restriction endonuclease McrA